MNFGQFKGQSAVTSIDITEIIKQITSIKKGDSFDKFIKDINSVCKTLNKNTEDLKKIEKGFTQAFTDTNPDFDESSKGLKMSEFVKNVPDVDLGLFDSIDFIPKYKFIVAIESHIFDIDNGTDFKSFPPKQVILDEYKKLKSALDQKKFKNKLQVVLLCLKAIYMIKRPDKSTELYEQIKLHDTELNKNFAEFFYLHNLGTSDTKKIKEVECKKMKRTILEGMSFVASNK